MTICIAGQSNIAIDVCEYILQTYKGATILAIINRNDNSKNRIQRSFSLYLEQKKVIKCVDLDYVYQIKDLIFLSLEFDRIINPKLFISKRLYNIHFSKLPEYKGMYTASLPILHMKQQSGVTLHCIDSGIDTGDIIAQRVYEMSENETAESLYLKNIEYGTDLVIENIDAIINQNYLAYSQDSKSSSYYSKKAIDYHNLTIELNCTAAQLDAQIRAYHFRQFQLPSVYQYQIVYTSILKEKSLQKSGTILEDNKSFIKLATIDYDIVLYKDRLLELMNYCQNNNLSSLCRVNNLKYFINLKEKKFGWTLLMVAAYNNSYEVAEYLINQGANVNLINYNGTTPLMYAKDGALKSGDTRLLDLLLRFGADKNVKDFFGKNILQYTKEQSIELYNHIKSF